VSEPGRITRWRMREPVRFYLWPVFAVLVVMVAWQVSVGEWPAAVVLALAAAGVFAAGEAARASVFSEPSNLRCVADAAQRTARGELIP
jgi:hypothetical protein